MEGPPARLGRGSGGRGVTDRLPLDCISLILSLTSPRDVCRSSAVSKAFLSAAVSDAAWDRFLPPDIQEILRRSSSPVAFSSKRELYFRFCEPSIPVDERNMILWLEKPTGRKCCMISARALGIIWGGDSRYWRWISVPGARFPEVAELLRVCWLEIGGRVSSRDLSPGTRYGAYLVLCLSDDPYGLDDPPQETEVFVGGVTASTRRVQLQEQEAGDIGEPQEAVPMLKDPAEGNEGVRVPRARGDGWMELEMGDFVVEAGGEALVEVKLRGWQSLHWKTGLIVHGIEFRPMP